MDKTEKKALIDELKDEDNVLDSPLQIIKLLKQIELNTRK